MAFRFIHSLIEKIKEAYNRPYIEAEREREERERKRREEQRNRAIARQKSDIFIHYCGWCCACDTTLPCSDCGSHMGCGGPIRAYEKVTKSSYNAMSDEEKTRVKIEITEYVAERGALWDAEYRRRYGKERPKCPKCHSATVMELPTPYRFVTNMQYQCFRCKRTWLMPRCPRCGSLNTVPIYVSTPAGSGKQYQCHNCKHMW